MEFTAKQVENYIDSFDEIDRIEGKDKRWTRTIKSIVKRDGKYYALEWEKGLTECQKNVFWYQYAPEVKRTEKTIVINEWVNI